MSITVTCPSCGHKTKAPDTAAGMTGKCPRCKSPVLVPRAAGPVESPQASDDGTTKSPDISLLADDGVIDAEIVTAEVVPAAAPRAVLSDPSQSNTTVRPPDPEEPIGLADASLSAANNPPPSVENQHHRPCPSCGEMIPHSSLKCRYCKETIDPGLKQQEERRKRRDAGITADDEQMTTADWIVALICSGIGCIVGIVWMIQGKPKGGRMLLISFCMAVLWAIFRIVFLATTGRFNELQ